VFIYYTVDSIMQALTCGNKKAGQLLAELDDKKGIGLISRVRQGLGKPDRIYVHKCTLPEMLLGHDKKCQNDMSGDVIPTHPEMSKGHANNTEINNTDISDTNPILSGRDVDKDERSDYREYLIEQLDMAVLYERYPYDREILDSILDMMLDVICSKRKTIRIAGDDKPVNVVKSQFMKLNGMHVEYVMGCLKNNPTKVRNIKQYLLATIYNAPLTMQSYYQACYDGESENEAEP
jgi:hypothetical protein